MNPISLLRDASFARPDALYLLALPVVVLLWSIINLRDWKGVFAPILRALALALFVLALAGPEKVRQIEGAARPAVVDLSASITPAMRGWESGLIRTQLKLRESDPSLMFAAQTIDSSVSGTVATLGDPAGCKECGPGATNLESALSALAADPAAHGGPAVIMTDGWQNRGDATRAINALLSAEIRLYIFTPPGAASVPNVAMTELSLPSALSKAAPFALGVTMENFNKTPVSGTIKIFRNGAPLDQRKVAYGQLAQHLRRQDCRLLAQQLPERQGVAWLDQPQRPLQRADLDRITGLERIVITAGDADDGRRAVDQLDADRVRRAHDDRPDR